MKSSLRRFFLTVITLLVLTLGLTGVTPVRAATLIVTNVNDSGAGSLRDAIASATNGDTITFDPSLSGQTIYLQAPLSIGQIITIDGSALAEKITLSGDSDNDGTGDVQVMNISNLSNYYPVTLNSLIITKGLAAKGGGIYNDYSALTIINSTISDNYASSYSDGGGAIYSYYSILTVTNSTVSGNAASESGGGIYNYGILTVTNSTISGNSASYGGGIFSGYGQNSTVTITNSTFSDNSAGDGGVIFNAGGVVTVTDSIFSGNTASDSHGGGAIFNGGTLNVNDSIFSDNSATHGGGINNGYYDSTATITNSTFSGNSASFEGGGIYNGYSSSGTVNITNSAFTGNSAGVGGGIFNDTGTTTVTGSTFSGNSAHFGGGIANKTVSTTTITHSTLAGNTASNEGGGIHNAGILTVSNSTLSGNSTQGSGGGIFNGYSGTATITNSTLSDNVAYLYGSGIANDNATLNYANTIIANSPPSGDCSNENGGTIGVNLNNLVEDGGCAAALSGDPLLGPLTDNGGVTQTFALLEGSPAIDAGDDAVCAAAPVNNTSQNGLLRPQRAHCDIGAYEAPALPTATPTVTETSTATETATMTASPTVTLTATETTTLTPTVTSTSTATATLTRTTTNTLTATTTLTSTATNTATATATFTPTITRTITKTATRTPTKTPVALTLYSIPAQDGWVLESGENSNVGGSIDSAALTFSLGDDAAKRQYRGVLSFQTGAGIPDNATITAVTLKVKQQGIIGGGNPVSSFQGFMADIRNGFFGTFAALQPLDFQSTASGSYGPFVFSPVNNSYNINLTAGKSFINKLAVNSGLTQICLRFKLDDNNNTVANVLNLYSGNAVNATDRPQLVIVYTVP